MQYGSPTAILRAREKLEARPELHDYRDRRRRARLILAVQLGITTVKVLEDAYRRRDTKYLKYMADRIHAVERYARAGRETTDRSGKMWQQARASVKADGPDLREQHGEYWEEVLREKGERDVEEAKRELFSRLPWASNSAK